MTSMQWLETGPGASLAQRREALGLTTEQAAAQLKVKPKVIRQLEQQSWDPKTAATFIRGYLRNYARLLKLDEQEVLSQFEPLLGQLPQQSTMHSFSRKTSRDAAESRFMLATYFLLVLLIGLFLIWFWQTHMLDDEPVSMLPELAPQQPVQTGAPVIRLESNPQPAAALNETPAPATSDLAEQQPVQQTAAQTGAQAEQGGTQRSAAQPPAQASDNPQDLAATAASAVAETPVPAAAAPTPAETQSGPGQTTGDAPADGMVQLQLSFSAACWVAVIDADNQRLFYNMRSSGQQLNLSGKAPLQLTLGDPAAASGSVNGKALDLSGYQRGQVARLTLTGSN